ncbi:TetR/AcrR family transcriptional regulator [Massilia sp. erpn]|uniref:TetR/AcrR family transcriptional regulator n=1 Tax=Massilia sp. erpn TaxID=2738142 RepID=UPI0021064061|nr:TetR/AcrR family transcriptional regulator [Massilia sp. erpn]UTY56547.1 TetR/AcrR family transcriptional regulator [Massilia sp. erpn]
MPKEIPIPAARQERSRATATRLLEATIAVLDDAGLDGAVIPRIAALAGVAPASVYRRYADKNALLRAAFLHVLDRSNESRRAELALLMPGATLAATARELLALLFAQYRQHPQLLRALTRFIENDSDHVFVAEARRLLRANVECIVELLLRHAGEISHPAPAAALRFGVLQLACAIEVYMLDPQSLWHVAPAFPEDELMAHLLHGFMAPLQCGAGGMPGGA